MKWTLTQLNKPLKWWLQRIKPVCSYYWFTMSPELNVHYCQDMKKCHHQHTSFFFQKKLLLTFGQSYSFSKITWTCEVKTLFCWPMRPGKQFWIDFEGAFVHVQINFEIHLMNFAAALRLKGSFSYHSQHNICIMIGL